MHRPHPFFRHTKGLYYLSSHELRVGVDPGTPAHGLLHQVGVGPSRRPAELGEVQRAQVVDRHHHGRLVRGRDDEIRPVYHVYFPGVQLGRGESPAGPGGVDQAGRHPGPRWPQRLYAWRQQRSDALPALPADRKGAHAEIRFGAEHLEDPQTELPDAGVRPL